MSPRGHMCGWYHMCNDVLHADWGILASSAGEHKKRPMVGSKCLECGQASREPPFDLLAQELLAIL